MSVCIEFKHGIETKKNGVKSEPGFDNKPSRNIQVTPTSEGV